MLNARGYKPTQGGAPTTVYIKWGAQEESQVLCRDGCERPPGKEGRA